jgi:long-chain acyl-CoA synthetase
MSIVVPFNTIPQLFLNLSNHFSSTGKTAFAFKPKGENTYKPINYDEFVGDVMAMASWMRNHGLNPGDRVAILSENRYEWAVCDMAMQLLGCVNVGLYPSLPSNQVEYIMQDSNSKILFVSTGIQLKKAVEIFEACPDLTTIVAYDDATNKEHMSMPFVQRYEDVLIGGRAIVGKMADAITATAKAIKPEDLCTLIYTSGTTGVQKGVMLTHDNICMNINHTVKLIQIDDADRSLSFLPLCHSFERVAGYYAMMACGAEIFYAESVETVSKNLGECHPTIVVSVPRLFERIYGLVARSIEEGSPLKKRIFRWAVGVGKEYAAGKRGLVSAQHALADRLVFSKLRQRTGGRIKYFVSGGAALPVDVGNFFTSAGLKIIEGYGLTETSPVISANTFANPRIGTVGQVITGVTVAIQRLSDNKIVAQLSGEQYPSDLDSEEGEILCKGHNVMKGYWNKPEATAEVMDADGWFHTGDIGRFNKGNLQITDRLKHMIVNAGGKNIYPGPIEDLLKTIPYIEQAVLLGEKQNFMSALIVPDYDALKIWARHQSISYSDERDLLSKSEVKSLFDKEIKQLSKTMASHEKIRDFRIIPDAFTIEGGEMTPTLKVKRRVIESKYADLIKEIYASDLKE